MSTAVARSFPRSKATEENRVGGRKASKPALSHTAKKQVSGSVNPGHVHPGKIFTSQPTTTPRRALGDLSNNAKKTPSTVLKQESQTLSVQKPKGPTKPSKTVKAGRESTVRKRSGVSVAQVQQQQKVVAAAPEEFPDIELMPVKGDKDISDPPFVAPSYFKSLASSLLATPLPLLDDLPLPDLMASLSMESDVRPKISLQHVKGYSHDIQDDFGSTIVDSLPPVEMPDIPDFTD